MFDGTSIQDRDILHIGSSRRNPVIADVFQRLNFMERRGSGIKKVYKSIGDKTKVSFYSDKSSFRVTLYNLNYRKKSGDKNGDKNGDKILKYLKENDYITTAAAKELLGLEVSRAREILSKIRIGLSILSYSALC